VASHTGSESCVGIREDVGEALTGVRAGWDIEPRKVYVREAEALFICRRQNPVARHRKSSRIPAGSKTPCTHASISRGSREILDSIRGGVAAGPRHESTKGER